MITDQYKKYLQTLNSNKKFSEKHFWYNDVKQFLLDHPLPNSVIDFGCSRGSLIEKIKVDFPSIQIVDGYDPGYAKFEQKPVGQYEMLISTDVIEHIEPEFLDTTLSYIESLYKKTAWIIIACYPAKKYLPDGRNAHLIVESTDWWLDKIKSTMPNSIIESKQVVVLNPDRAIKNKVLGGILIPAGRAIELRLVLRKK
jgi:hypothetical protein